MGLPGTARTYWLGWRMKSPRYALGLSRVEGLTLGLANSGREKCD